MIFRLDKHEDPEGPWGVIKSARGRMAWDVGANIGQSTKVLAQGFQKVLAFEPCEESAEILREEMPENVLVHDMAISSHDGDVMLDETSRSINTGQLVTGPGLGIWGEYIGARRVNCMTLDSLFYDYGTPDFIKIDVEGHEIEVVHGGRTALAACPSVFIEVHRKENEAVIRELLSDRTWVKLTHGDHIAESSDLKIHHFWLISENNA